jgi:hypothetical protein
VVQPLSLSLEEMFERPGVESAGGGDGEIF